MTEKLYFILGILNNLSLIFIFLVRGKHLDLLKKYGWLYMFLAVPAIYGIASTGPGREGMRYGIFLGIFLAYLFLECLYDFILKIDFRRDWKLLVPYLFLYYSMNYGFIVMPWKVSPKNGMVMLVLFIFQLAANIGTHEKKSAGSV
jgi:hypothetical protein